MALITGTTVSLVRRGARGAADEELGLTPDGALCLWVRRPADASRGDLVGSFRVAAPASLRRDLERIAVEIVAGRSAAGPDAPVEVVTAAGAALVGPGSAPEAGSLLALFDSATDLAVAHPLAAARFSAAVLPGGGGRGSSLSVLVTGVGRRAVTITIEPTELALARDDADPGVPGLLPRPVIGLVDADADLLDGIYAPARIRPGLVGSLGVRCDPPPATGSLVRVAGRILLLGPWPSIGIPTDDFRAAGRIRELPGAS